MKKLLFYSVALMAFLSTASCDQKTDYIVLPPKLHLDSVYKAYVSFPISVYESFHYALDTNVHEITVPAAGTKVKLFMRLRTDKALEQLDVQLNELNGAALINSFGDSIKLNGNPSLDWTNTTIRSGFQSTHTDMFEVYLPSVMKDASLVVLATDITGRQTPYRILLKIQ